MEGAITPWVFLDISQGHSHFTVQTPIRTEWVRNEINLQCIWKSACTSAGNPPDLTLKPLDYLQGFHWLTLCLRRNWIQQPMSSLFQSHFGMMDMSGAVSQRSHFLLCSPRFPYTLKICRGQFLTYLF